MNALTLLLATLAPFSSFADWSCISREGRLMNCESPADCHRFYPACVAVGKITDKACTNPHCRFLSQAEPAAKPVTELKKTAPAQSKPVPEAKMPRMEIPVAPSISSLAETKLAEIHEIVERVRSKMATQSPKSRGQSGLSPEEEARLFGESTAPAEPAKLEPHWSTFMQEPEHRRRIEELQKNKRLREELRRQLASRTTGKISYDPDSAALMNALLAEAEKQKGEPGKSSGDLKPLSPEEGFDLTPSEDEMPIKH